MDLNKKMTGFEFQALFILVLARFNNLKNLDLVKLEN